MITLKIEHNPFTIQTNIWVNGEIPAENSELSRFKSQRLQFWIDNFFGDLYAIFGQEREYEVDFTGVESDCIDVEAAVESANTNGFNIKLAFHRVENGENRLSKMKQLIEEAKANPLFSEYFNSNKETQKNLNTAFDNNFDVFVVATMSSGKSTFINSMLGCDLLPALNEATTATLAQINNNKARKQGQFTVSRLSREGDEIGPQREVNISDTSSKDEVSFIADWNKDPETACISIDGNLIGIEENENVRLVLTDTPGPNNSQDKSHAKTTMEQIENTERSPVILYILNASQLGIQDDQGLLDSISKAMSKGGKQSRDRFLFILNKADVFDPEKGEDLQKIVTRAKEYLCKNGIENPRVYPISAQFASLLRKRGLSPDLLTRSERGDLAKFEDLFTEEDSMDLIQYMPLNRSEQMTLDNKNHSEALKRSGVPAVEAVISEYINKYNLPHRVSRAHDVLKEVIKLSSNKEIITKALETDEKELSIIADSLEALNKQRDEALTSKGFIADLNDSAIADAVADNILNCFVDVLSELNKIGDTVAQGDVEPSQAKTRFTKLEERVNHVLLNLTIQLEKAHESSKESVEKDLLNKYQEHVSRVFESVEDIHTLNLPVFDSLKTRIGQLAEKAFVLDVSDQDIQKHERQVERTLMVEKRTWRSLWLWKSEVEETYTATVVDEKVNVVDLWDRHFVDIKIHLDKVSDLAVEESKKQAGEIVDKLCNFMAIEFDKAFSDLTADLYAQTQDKALREKNIQQATQNLDDINKFEEKLFRILSINENGAAS
ncbi:dynamin family protein [Neisseriaceae bacterium CLB008]